MAPSRPPRAPARALRDPKELLKKRGADLLRKISDRDRYGIFLQPVDVDAIDGYAQLIARPMDLSTCQNNLAMGVYRTPMELRADLDLIWSNCCTFNADDSIYFKEAVRLRALAARYYDDLVRALVKDGVASALGLSRGVRFGASAAHASSRDVHLRRARVSYDAAVTAAIAAIHEARQAAQLAGLPDAPPSTEEPIFNGPNNELRDASPAQYGASFVRKFPLLHSQRIRDSISQIPLAWRRIGRWHSRGATQPSLLTEDRVRNVRYGLQYERFVTESAPMARRLLACVLDAEVVQQHDVALMEKVSPVANGVSHGGEQALKKLSSAATANDVHGDGKKNGVTDAMDVDKEESRTRSNGENRTPKSRKRPRANNELTRANGAYTNHNDGGFRDQLRELIGHKRLKQVSAQRVEELSQSCLSVPPKQSIYRVRSLLRAKRIDPKFVSSLMTDDPESYSAEPQNNGAQDGGVSASHHRKVELLLNNNYETMMNVLRLRALRENCAESMVESVEDKERDSVERLADGLCLAVRSVPPRMLVHPADAAESLLCMARTINSQQPAGGDGGGGES
ncbi:Bromodomain containing protein [Gracilaria domingensis]|nr:Bromodomain containing protein [Gracilaria domingensis]